MLNISGDEQKVQPKIPNDCQPETDPCKISLEYQIIKVGQRRKKVTEKEQWNFDKPLKSSCLDIHWASK